MSKALSSCKSLQLNSNIERLLDEDHSLSTSILITITNIIKNEYQVYNNLYLTNNKHKNTSFNTKTQEVFLFFSQ